MLGSIANIGLAFIEGFALIISPCVLPILPIILAGSLTGGKSRPFGIIVGFVTTFAILTLFTRSLIHFLHIEADTLRTVSYILLLLLGALMVSTFLSERFTSLTNRLANAGHSLKTANDPQSGFWGGFIFGGLVSVIWTPCAGPVLAAVIVQVIMQTTTLQSILTLISFTLGVALPMLLIALLGRRILNKFNFFKRHTTLFRKLLGLIIIGAVLFLSYDANSNMSTARACSVQKTTSGITNELANPYKAPELVGIDAWINSSPLTLEDLKNKVILIDFWTYSCINCTRTIPYLNAWYEKYKSKGLVIIGVHSPEFEFEHDILNVSKAVEKFKIHYPVALDNNFLTWKNFNNQYWPAHYLINQQGEVVYEHVGEGKPEEIENNIRYLLGLGATSNEVKENQPYNASQTPEIYLGYKRANRFANEEKLQKQESKFYTYPTNLPKHQWALHGDWQILPEKIVAEKANASIRLHFNASKIYAVMGVSGQPVDVQIKVNGILQSPLQVKGHQLYLLVSLPSQKEGELELIASQPGLEMYSFTFGSD